MPRGHMTTSRQMDIELVSGLVFSEEQSSACHRNEKQSWKQCPVGVGIFCQISGKKAFAILRNLLHTKVMPELLKITKQQMDFVLGSGFKVNDQEKTICLWLRKFEWKHYPDGLGMLYQTCGKMDFAISWNSLSERGIPRFVKITKQQMDIG